VIDEVGVGRKLKSLVKYFFFNHKKSAQNIQFYNSSITFESRSSSVQQRMENEEKPKTEEPKVEEEESKSPIRTEEDLKDKRPSEKRENRERPSETRDRKKCSRSESPFHKYCRPSEPNREFVAKPIPPKLLSKQSPIKIRPNGNNNLIDATKLLNATTHLSSQCTFIN
jgi:hypothetical protein